MDTIAIPLHVKDPSMPDMILPEELVNDFEDVLRYVGGWDRYQITLLFVFFAFTMFLSYVAYAPILFLYVPDHWCSAGPQWDNNTLLSKQELMSLVNPLDPEIGRPSQCFMYDVDPRIVLGEGSVAPDPSWPQVPCKFGWEYNFTGYFTTAATDMDWVCEDSWKPAFTQSMFFVGGIVGTIFFGYTADNLGRRWTFLASNCVLMATGIATPFCNNFAAFTAVRFLMGLSHPTFFSSFFLLSLEYVSIRKRALVGNLSLAVAMTVGGCIQPWLIKWLGHWKAFHHALFAQTVVVFLAPLIVNESVRWLMSKGRTEDAVTILRYIAGKNGKDVPEEVYNSFRRLSERKARGRQRNWTALFCTARLRKHTVIMVVTWMLIAGMFDGHIRNIANLHYSIYVTFTISAALELPADLAAVWGLDFVGRRWSAFGSQLLAAACMAVCACATEDAVVSTTFAMVGRFFMTYAMNTGAQISFEVVPTELRGQGNALANVFSQVAQFFSPYIVYSSVLHLPFVILALGACLGAATSLALPETANVDLPDTVEEAEDFGKQQRFLHVPFLERRRAKARDRAEAEESQALASAREASAEPQC